MIGRIGGWVLPSPVSPTQLMVWLGSFGALLMTRGLWAHLGAANSIIQAVLPLSLAWMVRHLRVEGRSPLQAALGLMCLLSAPRHGVLHGRAYREGSPGRLRGTSLFFSERPPHADRRVAPVAVLTFDEQPEDASEATPADASWIATEGAA